MADAWYPAMHGTRIACGSAVVSVGFVGEPFETFRTLWPGIEPKWFQSDLLVCKRDGSDALWQFGLVGGPPVPLPGTVGEGFNQFACSGLGQWAGAVGVARALKTSWGLVVPRGFRPTWSADGQTFGYLVRDAQNDRVVSVWINGVAIHTGRDLEALTLSNRGEAAWVDGTGVLWGWQPGTTRPVVLSLDRAFAEYDPQLVIWQDETWVVSHHDGPRLYARPWGRTEGRRFNGYTFTPTAAVVADGSAWLAWRRPDGGLMQERLAGPFVSLVPIDDTDDDPPPPPEKPPMNTDYKDFRWSACEVHLGPADIGTWRVTATLREAAYLGLDDHRSAFPWSGPSWPGVVTAQGPAPLNGNVWLIAKIGGRWHATTFDWLRAPYQDTKDEDARSAAHEQTQGRPPWKTWTPQAGEVVGLMVSTLARGAERNGNERSGVAFVTIGTSGVIGRESVTPPPEDDDPPPPPPPPPAKPLFPAISDAEFTDVSQRLEHIYVVNLGRVPGFLTALDPLGRGRWMTDYLTARAADQTHDQALALVRERIKTIVVGGGGTWTEG